MRILWVGDAVVATGFSACSHTVCDALAAAGHDVHILGINYDGNPHYHPYRIYPCRAPNSGGIDGMGMTRLPYLIDELRPDVVCILQDPWNIAGYFAQLDRVLPTLDPDLAPPPIIGWIAVDGQNQRDAPHLNRLAHVAVWTNFALGALRLGGYTGPASVIPLGVDTDRFRPYDRSMCRREIFKDVATAADGTTRPVVSDTSFVVGVVGRNQPRKRLDLTIAYFAEFVRQCHARGQLSAIDPHIHFHVAPTGESGADLLSLGAWHNLGGRMWITTPPIGQGVHPSRMPLVYSAYDVLLTTSQGEGWGLPMLEAMACGVPVVAPDWSGLGSWAQDAAYLIPCSSTAATAPLNAKSGPYTIGGIPDEMRTVEALLDLASSPSTKVRYSQAGTERARSLPWSATAASFLALVERVVEENQRRR